METNNDIFNYDDNVIDDELVYENNEMSLLTTKNTENVTDYKTETPQLATIERFAKYFISKETFDPMTGEEIFDSDNGNHPLDENEISFILRNAKKDESDNRIITYNDLLNLKTHCADYEGKYTDKNNNFIGYIRYFDVTFFQRKLDMSDIELQRAVNLDTSADLNQFNDYVEYRILTEKTYEGYGCIVDIYEDDDEIESY